MRGPKLDVDFNDFRYLLEHKRFIFKTMSQEAFIILHHVIFMTKG